MKTYQVTGKSANVNAGKVIITAEQAARRKHAIKDLGEGVFEVLQPIQFKKGETFGFDGSVSKAMTVEMAEVEPENGLPEAEESTENEETESQSPEEVDPRDDLKAQLDELGVSYRANASQATLQKLVDDALAE